MKYMSNQCAKNSLRMAKGDDEFIVRTQFNLKMMENFQRTSPKKVKRFRSAFTTDQVNYLEQQFKKFPYIGNAQRKEVAVALNIPERAVKIWFQNRRMKEKKDTNKEFDEETCNRKTLEFGKDQFINGCQPSTNDIQSYSLPLLTKTNNVKSDKIMVANNFSCGVSTGLLVQDSGVKVFEDRNPVHSVLTPPALIKPRLTMSPTSYLKSAEFSIDLCKKYKTEGLNKPNYVKPILDKEQLDIKQTTEQKQMNCSFLEQMVPEDLSSSGKVNVPVASQAGLSNTAPSHPNNPGYISVVPTVPPFYAQPYCNTNGVVWKPINVAPTLTPPDASALAPYSLGSVPAVQDRSKKCCSCDCHVKPQLHYNVQQHSTSPQYIITAVQLPNSSATKF